MRSDAPTILRASGLVAVTATLAVCIALAGGCEVRSGASATATSPGAIATSRDELLDLAFESAAAIPTDPHVKDRARSLERVTAAALALDQVDRAARYAEEIGNWRRGVALAEIAKRQAADGRGDEARETLARAERLINENEEWRQERVAMAVAAARLSIEGGAAQSSPDDRTVEAMIADVPVIAARGDFGETKGALEACVALHRLHYGEAERRALLESAITAGWTRLPIAVRVALVSGLSANALQAGDSVRARELAAQARTIVDGATWLAEEEIPVLATLAELRHRAGAPDAARADLAKAISVFRLRRAEIIEVDRARALGAIAAGYARTGDPTSAHTLFAEAIEEGASNPNARPRAMDLAATCALMAECGIEPGEALAGRIRSILGGLGNPW